MVFPPVWGLLWHETAIYNFGVFSILQGKLSLTFKYCTVIWTNLNFPKLLQTWKMHLFSLFFTWKSKHADNYLGQRKERERESVCEKVFRNRIFRNTKYVAYDLFYIYNIMNIFLLWIYVRVNFFQFHDVVYSFFNSIRVNTHWSL